MDTFIDERDKKEYKTIKIGNVLWLAENLAYNTNDDNCVAYENKKEYVKTHGYLYNYEGTKHACLQGWRIPTYFDWKKLLEFINKDDEINNLAVNTNKDFYDILNNSNELKIKFNVLASGYKFNGEFKEFNKYTKWWLDNTENLSVLLKEEVRYTEFKNKLNNLYCYLRCVKNI